MMTKEQTETFEIAGKALLAVIHGLHKWALTLEGSEGKEALFHIAALSTSYDNLTLAMVDYAGGME